ncbi:LOW QUALITY PROTEIN: phospholipid phosphatase-related protein type 4-like [Sphaeramia orbicularis]|uniref:LOW QUALITY PROTEIN: phospholipid phosphatase-related protein type 4-like n=1 Tax=Sphaeramia orbicularis TaxID=375764 RepID=UPI00117D0B9F|nr:LOW QUALITY PROTEIN: phospholipid phosphatase-related protein type 4-like [Sphaeramia orbicularis]
MSARDKGVLTKDSVSLLPCFYFVEMPILVSFVVSLYFLEWTDVFKPVKSGFNCHDRSLSLPYVDPNHEVIPLLMLLSLAFAGPAITIMIGEAILFCCLSRRKSGAGAEANINAAGCNFNSFIRRAVRFVGVHAFGLCATALITDILQLMTGYPTPYFLTVCKPNYTTLNVSCEQNPYVMEDICSGPDPAAINQGRKSFPSQHATLASFAAVYVSMYFNSTLTDSSKLLKPLLVFSFIICAIICGLTRIIQYKNHAIDVYLGFLLGGAIAVYLGLYAVGNFQPSEDASTSPPPQLHRPPCSLPHISQEAVLHHLQMKASMAAEPGLPTSHSEGLLHRGLQQQRPEDTLKRPGADADAISPRSPQNKDAFATFSHTLPRVHTPQAMAAYEEAARRHAATLHHASMDSSRSKQLLSQWKSKNNNHKCSLQVPDSFSSSVDSSSGQSSQHPHHHGSMELRSSSEPSAMGLNGGFDGHAYMSKLPTGASTTLPSNCSGITGGARIAMQSRPGSSQLVHIPEEAHENYNAASPRTMGGDTISTVNSTVQANWQRAAEKSAACRTNDGIPVPQPRIMQVIAMSKQQGLLQTHSKSLDESSIGCGTTASCQTSARFKALTDQDGASTTGASSVGSICGSTGAIVRVEAHPENNKPVIQPPSTDGSGSWRWRSLDHGTGAGGGGSGGTGSAGGGNLRQSFELNDLNRDSESSDSVREGSIDRKRANHIVTTTATVSTPPIVTVHTQNTGQYEQRLHPQGLSTIRVTPGDSCTSGSGGGGVAGGAGGETTSDTPSVASSRESTLRRKGNNVILIPERANSPDNTRNIFYKGTSITPTFKE